jgi:squalene-hopene/tetraprenyl-beta-curcumene cyclase
MMFQPQHSLADAQAAVQGYAPVEESTDVLDASIERAVRGLLAHQDVDGYWWYEFEADCTIPAEYILMMHFMGEVDEALEPKIAVYLRDHQVDEHGGWSLYYGGDFDLSCSIKAYYALKLVGDSPDEPHMVRARQAILEHGGAARANVFTRITLALFGQIPWRGVPFIPVEIMLLPKWFPFHIRKVSYWSRTVMVPLFVLCSLKPRAANPRGVHIRELFTTPPEQERNYFPIRSGLNRVFLVLDQVGRTLEPLVPRWLRQRAVKHAEEFVTERLNGEHGLGGIFPAMVNAHEMYAVLGYPADHPHRVQTKQALQSLLVVKEDHAYCQPCLSPIWDTVLACLSLQEVLGGDDGDVLRALDWLGQRQLLEEPGDWQWTRPGLRGGGWAFEFRNDHYPDIDDTSAVGWAMVQSRTGRYGEAMEQAAEWIQGMQSHNGGWGSFDADNTYYYLNEIPFADHGALLDPPTSDVTARCVTFLSRLDGERWRPSIEAGIRFLREEQESDGSWFGRWGTNYVYGTWSVLEALAAAGEALDQPYIRLAVAWLKRVQRADGGWGETNDTYAYPALAGQSHVSTSFQTAWALLGLMAAGEADGDAVRRGVDYLLRTQRYDGLWHEPEFSAPGFPRVFYLKYHGYSKYFPLWALARYRNLCRRRELG